MASVTDIDVTKRAAQPLRHDWTRPEALALYDLPLMDLLFRAHTVHRQSFDPNKVQMSHRPRPRCRLGAARGGGCPQR